MPARCILGLPTWVRVIHKQPALVRRKKVMPQEQEKGLTSSRFTGNKPLFYDNMPFATNVRTKEREGHGDLSGIFKQWEECTEHAEQSPYISIHIR